ncbi:hypothetical protein YC2023_053402 [Brassica napus]|uniref:(rape) hypothetical protein n=1 Tax=Brassica napus TaxID=3708 RepID=A0A816JRL6_BRANA|nr:unnamed protein product [Brassica napus]
MISAHASGKSQVALIDAKGIFSDTLDHIYFAYCCKLDCNPEIAKLVNEEEVTKAETKDPPRLNLSCRYATQINMPNYLAPFDPTKKKKMKVLLMAFRVHLLDRTQSSRNFSIYLTKGSHSPSLRQWFGRMLYLILKKLSPRAESRPELEFLNINMIFENLARLRLM